MASRGLPVALKIRRSHGPSITGIHEGQIFPQEIFDIIIDFLNDDTPSLKQCSLVCRAWTTTSSVHLFAMFRWPQCPMSAHAEGFKCKPRICGTRCFPECLATLSKSSRICASLRHLTLSTHSCMRYYSHEHQPGVPLSLDILFSILSLMPRLSSLSLISCSVLPSNSPINFQLPHTLTSLYFSSQTTKFQPVADLLSAICSSNVLSIDWQPYRAEWEGEETDEPHGTRASQRMTVDYLDLTNQRFRGTQATVLRFLDTGVDLQALRCLMLRSPLTPELVAVLTPIMSQSTLKAFSYAADPLYDPSMIAHLRLKNVVVYARGQPDDATPWDALLRDVNVLVHGGLHTLGLGIELSNGDLLLQTVRPSRDAMRCLDAVFDWERLQSALQRYRSLATVCIEISWDSFSRCDYPCSCELVMIMRNMVKEKLPEELWSKVMAPFAAECSEPSTAPHNCPRRTP